MDQPIGVCPQCYSLVWAQVDGDFPIPIKPTCSCWGNEVKLFKGLEWEIWRKIDLLSTTVIMPEQEEPNNDNR